MTTIHAGTKWLSFYVCNPSVHVRHIELFHKKIRRQQQQKKGINVLSIFIFLFSPVKIHDQPTYQTWYGCNLEVLCVNSSLMCIAKFNPLKIQGHPTGNFEKKTQKQQQSVNKVFWDYFKQFGRLLEKNYLFLTPSKTDERVPSQQPYNLQPHLLGSFIGHNSDLEW